MTAKKKKITDVGDQEDVLLTYFNNKGRFVKKDILWVKRITTKRQLTEVCKKLRKKKLWGWILVECDLFEARLV